MVASRFCALTALFHVGQMELGATFGAQPVLAYFCWKRSTVLLLSWHSTPQTTPKPSAPTAPAPSAAAVTVRGVQKGWLVAGCSGGGGGGACASAGAAAGTGAGTAATGGGSATNVRWATWPAVVSTSATLFEFAESLATSTWCPG